MRDPANRGWRPYALAAALGYVAFGAAWILGSDALVQIVAADATDAARLQSAKGLAFVLLSAAYVYAIVRLYGRPVDEPASVVAAGGTLPRLRWQLILLAAALALPLVALLLFNVLRETRQDRRAADDEVRTRARLVAADATRVVRDTMSSAAAIARRPDVASLDPKRCDPRLQEIAALLPHVATVITVARTGEVVCAAVAHPALPRNVADHPDFAGLMGAGGAGAGRLTVNPLDGGWMVPVADLIVDAENHPRGAVIVPIGVDRLALPEETAPAVPGGFVVIVDPTGREVMRAPAKRPAGRDASAEPLVTMALAAGDGTGHGRDADGIDYIVGYAKVEATDWIALAALPESAALASSRATAVRSALMGIALLLAAGLAAYFAARRIERPMRAIAAAAHRVAEGDLAARAPVGGSLEAAEVATRLNELLDRLPRIEAKLLDSEARLALVLAAAQEGVILYGADGVVTFANDVGARLIGHPGAAAILGKAIRTLLPDELRHGADERRTARAAGRADRYEVRLADDQGGHRWVFVSATPLRSPTGAFAGVLAMLSDVTERRRAEARAERLSHLYRALSRVNEAVVRTQDAHALFRETCRVVVEEGGFTGGFVARFEPRTMTIEPIAAAGRTSGISGEQPFSIAPGAALESGPVAQAIRSGESLVVNDVEGDPRAATVRPIAAAVGFRSTATFPLRAGGAVVAVLVVYSTEIGHFDPELVGLLQQVADDVSFALDVYDRAQARDRAEAQARDLAATLERRVAERTRSLTEANRELEAFSYTVSHDLRAPVRAINGFAQLLDEHAGAALDGEGRRLVTNIVRSSRHMGRLIDDLLAFAQLGRRAIEVGPVPIAGVVERVVDELRPMADAQGARIEISPAPPTVRGEPTLLHQILLNLVANAIEYHRPGVRPVVRIGWREAGARVEISVSDEGLGIAPEHHARIFAMFERLHPSSTHPGTGIGLAVVAKAVALLQGEVRLDSAAGRGSTFTVSLPGIAGDSSADPAR